MVDALIKSSQNKQINLYRGFYANTIHDITAEYNAKQMMLFGHTINLN